MPVLNSLVDRDGVLYTLYVNAVIHPSEGHPLHHESTRLKLSTCTVNGRTVPLIDVELPPRARVFFFDGPFLVFQDTAGNGVGCLPPNYE